MKRETAALHAGFRNDPATKAVSVPIYQNVAYELDGDLGHIADIYNVRADGYTYSRIINPTNRALERRWAGVEGAPDSLATASGQAATFTAIGNLIGHEPGGNVVTSPYLYGNSWNLLHNTFRRLGIEARVADPLDPESFARQIDDRTICLFGEVLSNPRLMPFPVAEIAEIGRRHGVPVVIDNTTTPLVCRPGERGAAVATYSATKYICGHGTTVAGLLVDTGVFDFSAHPERFPLFSGPDDAHGNVLWSEAINDVSDLGGSAYLLKARMTWVRDTGGAIAPFNAFQLIQGIETLPLRMTRHSESAAEVADMLSRHPKVERVIYPGRFTGREKEIVDDTLSGDYGYGAMLMFDVIGGEPAGRRLVTNVELLYHVSNVGDARTLITHPVSTTHTTMPREAREAAGLFDGSIRLCVGLEHPDDIIRDLERALDQV